MTRLADWEAQLLDYLNTNKCQPFEWGKRDCILFAAGAIEAMTGEHPASDLPGSYSSATGARRALKEMGAATLQEAITGILGEPLEAIAKAGRGDLLGFVDPHGLFDLALGVSTGREAFTVNEGFGCTALPLKHAIVAWRV